VLLLVLLLLLLLLGWHKQMQIQGITSPALLLRHAGAAAGTCC
jgi:hypothetical protein